MASLSTLTRALSHRNAKIFFGASLTAWTGLWVHRIAKSHNYSCSKPLPSPRSVESRVC